MEKEATVMSVCTQKGGSGKTTIGISLAVTLAIEKNKKVLMIDADRQASIVGLVEDQDGKSCFDYETMSLKDMTYEEWIDSIEECVNRNKLKYDFIFIDIPGYTDDSLVAVFAYIEVAIIPIIMSSVDRNSTFDFVHDTIAKVKALKSSEGERFETYGVLNMYTNKKSNRQAYEFAEEALEIQLLNNCFSYRSKHYDEGLSLSKSLTTKRIKEDGKYVYVTDKEHEVYKIVDELLENINN